MNLVGGVTTFPVLVRNNETLERSEAAICHMEAQGCLDLAVVVQRNLLITQGLHAVDVLLLTFHVWEVLTLSGGKQRGQWRRFQHKTQ